MYKDFDTWNKEKKILESNGFKRLRFHEREIWWCSLGINLGFEQDGKNEFFERPVLVIKKFNDQLAWVLPLTSKIKKGKYYYVLKYRDKTFVLILSQLRVVSVKRFRRILRKISPHQFNMIKRRVVTIFLK